VYKRQPVACGLIIWIAMFYSSLSKAEPLYLNPFSIAILPITVSFTIFAGTNSIQQTILRCKGLNTKQFNSITTEVMKSEYIKPYKNIPFKQKIKNLYQFLIKPVPESLIQTDLL
jgi:hypothetical protein